MTQGQNVPDDLLSNLLLPSFPVDVDRVVDAALTAWKDGRSRSDVTHQSVFRSAAQPEGSGASWKRGNVHIWMCGWDYVQVGR